MLNKLGLLSVTIVLAACGGTEYSDDPQSMMPRLQEFESARSALDGVAEAHQETILNSDAVSAVTLAELHWTQSSARFVKDMGETIESMKLCRDAAGSAIEIADAREALAELKLELRAHEVAMLTVVDTETAHAIEQALDARLDVLVLELRAHFEAFEAVADSYSCVF